MCFVANSKHVSIEPFQSSNKTYYYLQSRLNNKVVQLYKGTIDTTLTMNDPRDDYYPQLWSFENNYLRSVFNNKYLTVSDDGTKVRLSPLDTTKHQKWKLTPEGYFVNLKKESQALTIEGDNRSEDAMVSVDTIIDKNSFKWNLITVRVDIKLAELVKGEISGKTEREISGDAIVNSNGYTYSTWFYVNDPKYRNNDMRVVFLRGTKNEERRTPGLYIVPRKNKLSVTVTTDRNNSEGIFESRFTFDPETWYYLSFVISDGVLQFYVNGQISEEVGITGTIIHEGNIYTGLKGGFDGIITRLEYVNKPLVSTEIIQNMNRTNPDKECEQKLPTTIVSNNIARPIDEWTNKGGKKIKNNKMCPPKNHGGITTQFTVDRMATLESKVNLLPKQIYEISLWSRSTKSVNIRPYSHNWKGEWRTIRSDWKQFTWEFLNVEKTSDFGFEMNTTDTSTVTLFLPVVKVKTTRVEEGNIVVKSWRSNGTHSTCNVKDAVLNSEKGWCATKEVRDKYYIEAQFDKIYQVQKIRTRGRADYPQWTTQYRIEFNDVYYDKWTLYSDGVVLEGNSDMNKLKENGVNILTDKIRIYPVSYHSWPAMRVGFSGIEAKKDKCMEYKARSETDPNIAERQKYLNSYNKECKTINFYEHQKQLERERELLEGLEEKLRSSEISAKTYEAKYEDSMERIRKLEKEIEKLNLEKEIIGGNSRDMESIELNSNCEPLNAPFDDEEPVVKETIHKDDDVSSKLDKIIRSINRKQNRMDKIENKIKVLNSVASCRGSTETQNKLLGKKVKTQRQIDSLVNELKKCKSQFTEGFENPAAANSTLTCSMDNGIPISIDRSVFDNAAGPDTYDIKKHRQYKTLMDNIQNKIKSEYTCVKKGQENDISKCKPFNTMDIRKHKDFPAITKSIFEIARSEMKDITKHADYNKMVREVEQRTIKAYGRSTPYGYTKCPTSQDFMNNLDIRTHPQFNEIIKEVVRRVVSKYGYPVPGTDPVLYKPCSSSEITKCMNSFNPVTGKNTTESFENYDRFDIRNHRQYPELMKMLEEKKVGDTVPKSTINDLKNKTEVKLNQISENRDEYQKLLKAYKDLVSEQKKSDKTGGVNFDELQDAYKNLKEKYELCMKGQSINADITKHPDIDKYVLKTSLPIDLNVKSLYDQQIELLKRELAKLLAVHSKCAGVVESFVGSESISVQEAEEAKVLVDNVNKLITKMNQNMSMEDKGQFEEIKNACRHAFNYVSFMDEKAINFLEDVYKDVSAVQVNEKELSELIRKYSKADEQKSPQAELSKMIQLEMNKASNDKVIEKNLKELDKLKDKISTSETEKKLDDSKKAIETTVNKLADGQVENPAEDAAYLRRMRKTLESENKSMDTNLLKLREKYDRLKLVAEDYEFKNKYIRNELSTLKKRCNERITRLWEENANIRKSVEDRENNNKKREHRLDRKQKELEEREEKMLAMRNSQVEKYQYFQNKLQEERSVTDKYKIQLEKLRDNLEKEKGVWDSKRIQLENQISSVRDECSNRVDRFRRMYEEGEKLLGELRLRSMGAPDVVEKIDRLNSKMAESVDRAITKTEQLKASPNPSMKEQVAIDNKLLGDINMVVGKVCDIEKKIGEKPEDKMWYNNRYSVFQ